MKVLVLNAGSSSLKWKLFEMETHTVIASGLVEGISEYHSVFNLTHLDNTVKIEHAIKDHNEAFTLLFETLNSQNITKVESLDAICHRVVHGGERFTQPTLIDKSILHELRSLNTLAPLHNPANLLGIEITYTLAPNIPNVAVFDTAFHQSMPEYAYRYALTNELYTQDHIRRYGFHGTSHHYVALAAAKIHETPLEELNLITLHLGNGASACAIKNGKSVDTSMGFTPLEGLVMGTRSGDIDPAIVTYLMEHKNLSSQEVNRLLNKESGLKGLCHDNDLRTIIKRAESGDKLAKLALDIFTYRIKKYIGAYIAVLGRVDAIVFTGGIGEHSPLIRAMVLKGLDEAFGILLDNTKNDEREERGIHRIQSRIKLYVITTNEELQIAMESLKVIK